MKKILRILLLGLLIFGAWLGYSLFSPLPPGAQKFVVLKPGSSTRTIAADLEREGVLRSANAFLIVHLLRGKRTLKAGEYSFDQPADAFQVYDRLARGDVYFRIVIIPEGFNVFDVASALDSANLCKREDFLHMAQNDTAIISDLDPQARSLEGYLFPDTYHFSRSQSPHEMAATMVKRFRQEANAIGLTHDIHRTVTLASIVEKETALASERPLIAGVFENRLAKHIGLATDPSVIYAALLAGRYRGTIHQSDLTFVSPYNTYRNVGLPPGPIANPGRASLLAALHPVSSDFLYFVADNKGGHNFARTIAEHNRNVVAYRRGGTSTK